MEAQALTEGNRCSPMWASFRGCTSTSGLFLLQSSLKVKCTAVFRLKQSESFILIWHSSSFPTGLSCSFTTANNILLQSDRRNTPLRCNYSGLSEDGVPWESAKDRYEQQQPFFTLCGIIGVLREPPRKWMCVVNMKLSVLFHIIVA